MLTRPDYLVPYIEKKKISIVCTCGAKDAISTEKRRQKQVQPVSGNSSQSSNKTVEMMLRKRSLWRKLVGKGPKCICKPAELLPIPDEFVGRSRVLVAGKRVPFTREMQQTIRKSWNPLDAIDE